MLPSVVITDLDVLITKHTIKYIFLIFLTMKVFHCMLVKLYIELQVLQII